ncbi:MAG: hypothetical protein AB1646_13910 [Thermodesulfobacteriota bacterium]
MSHGTESTSRWYKTRFGKAMFIGGVLIVAATALAFVLADKKRHSCDRAAQSDMSKLGACLERLQEELADRNCRDGAADFNEEHLTYLVGPYYGWSGTTRRCVVCVRMQGKEIWGCAKYGTAQEGLRNARAIYRVSVLEPTRELAPIVGECTGREYPEPTAPTTYTESMIDASCQYKKPGGIESFEEYPTTGGGRRKRNAP